METWQYPNQTRLPGGGGGGGVQKGRGSPPPQNLWKSDHPRILKIEGILVKIGTVTEKKGGNGINVTYFPNIGYLAPPA